MQVASIPIEDKDKVEDKVAKEAADNNNRLIQNVLDAARTIEGLSASLPSVAAAATVA